MNYFAQSAIQTLERSFFQKTSIYYVACSRFLPYFLLKQKVSPGFLQGNFDQSLLFLSKDDFKKTFQNYLKPIKKLSIEERKGWVSGLGHGILPSTPEENVKLMIEMIREEFI